MTYFFDKNEKNFVLLRFIINFMYSENKTTRRRLAGSYLISLMSIMLVLLVLGMFASLLFYANELSDYIKENIGFEIVMKKGVKESEILKFQQKLDKYDFVKSSTYISQKDATSQLEEDLGIDIKEWLGNVDNPLLPSIDVRFISSYANADSIAMIEKLLTNNTVVKDVIYQKNLTNILNNNIRRISIVLFVIGIVLLVMAVTLISHTVRLSVYSKRFLVRSMQLVGATESFILKPFLRFFMVQGFFGAVLSLIVLTFMIVGLQRSIPELSMVSNFSTIAMIYAAVLLFGMMLTIIASYFSMRKYLNADIDNLYA